MSYDILIKNAKTRKCAELVSIGINDGKITAIEKELKEDAKQIIDAKGCLVTESFVNGHLHLDKVYTFVMAGETALKEYNENGMGGAMTGIERAADFKASYDESWILPNVRKACDLAVKYGNTHIRAFADVDTKARLEGVKSLLKAREEYKDRVELQVVAFPQDGIAREPGAKELIREAIELGADVVGGIPWIEFSKEDEQDHVDSMCAYAKEYNKPISMLLDDVGDAEERTLEMLCKQSIAMGWQGRVTAQHCRAMELYPENYFRKLVALMKKAGIGLISDPHTGPMITTEAAAVLGIENHELKVGGDADLVVLDQPDVYHAIWYHRAPVYVIRKGVDITLK